MLERFQIDAHPDELLGELGPAQQTMVAIARALQDQREDSDDVLILDEPTASLPAPEVELLLDALRRYADRGQSIVYVTHRLEEVFVAGDQATLLRDGRIVDTVEPELAHPRRPGRTDDGPHGHADRAPARRAAEGGPVLEAQAASRAGPVRASTSPSARARSSASPA